METWQEALGGPWAELVSPGLSPEDGARIHRLWTEVVGQTEVFPTREYVFQAFKHVHPTGTRVVVLGQDPYHGLGQAHGLAFSVQHGVKVPPSLRNILKELAADVPATRWREEPAGAGLLSGWAVQGVLLLNAVLTVAEGRAGAHRKQGWEALTSAVVKGLADAAGPRVFILWGKSAAECAPLVHRPDHLVLEAPHPSPLSAHRGFFGSRPFSQANQWLEQAGVSPVDWWRGIPNR